MERGKNYQLYGLAKTKGIKVKVTEVERTAGTSKLIAIALRRMRAQAGDLRLMLEGVLEVARLFVEVAARKRECQRLESAGRRRAFRRNLFIGRLE
jgi:hypothetical protein